MPRPPRLSPSERQSIAGLVPLLAICITLAEYLFDHTEPRYASPWFWAGLVTTVGLLALVQVLRFMKSSVQQPAKPDYSATSLIRRRVSGGDQEDL